VRLALTFAPARGRPGRAFDPRAVGLLEARVWEAYYRRRWGVFLLASVAVVRAAFGLSWAHTLRGAWLVLRANQKWAPSPDNDPDAARALMRSFYALLREADGDDLDPARAADLEVTWWRVHRDHQRTPRPGSRDALSAALRDLYATSYGVPADAVHPAAVLRADAMDVSDRWVAAGAGPADPLLAEIRVLLVRSYAALLSAVHR
jgi:hypothetical protein